jgi:hypothetical protein
MTAKRIRKNTQREETLKSACESLFGKLLQRGYTPSVRASLAEGSLPRGETCPHSKKVFLYVSPKPSWVQVIAVLAHEVRHVEHIQSGLFSDYYNLEKIFRLVAEIEKGNSIKTGAGKRLEWMDEQEGSLAELDCNQAAKKFLYAIGVQENEIPDFLDSYEESHSVAFKINRMLEAVRNKKSPRAQKKLDERYLTQSASA